MEILKLVNFPQPLNFSIRIYKKDEGERGRVYTLSTDEISKYEIKDTYPNMRYHTALNAKGVK